MINTTNKFLTIPSDDAHKKKIVHFKIGLVKLLVLVSPKSIVKNRTKINKITI